MYSTSMGIHRWTDDHACFHEIVETWSYHQIYFSVTLFFIYLGRTSWWAWSLLILIPLACHLAGGKGCLCICLPSARTTGGYHICPAFMGLLRISVTGLHACLESVLFTKPFLNPLIVRISPILNLLWMLLKYITLLSVFFQVLKWISD